MLFFPSRRQWSAWSLTSKLTAIGTLVGVLSLCLYLAEKSLPFLNWRPAPTAPLGVQAVALALQDTTGELIDIQRRGEFILWLPQGVDDLRRLPGRYELERPNDENTKATIVVGPRAEIRVLATLYSEVQLARVLDGGAADLEFIFRKGQGGLLFSGSIPFNRKGITTTLWKIDLGRKE